MLEDGFQHYLRYYVGVSLQLLTLYYKMNRFVSTESTLPLTVTIFCFYKTCRVKDQYMTDVDAGCSINNCELMTSSEQLCNKSSFILPLVVWMILNCHK